jgi:hypothetical protein
VEAACAEALKKAIFHSAGIVDRSEAPGATTWMQAEERYNKGISERLDERISRLKRHAKRLEGISNRYWWTRRWILICGIFLTPLFCKYFGRTGSLVLAATLVVAFCVVAIYHKKIQDSITRCAHYVSMKQIQIARVQLDWSKIPSLGESLPDPTHPFEADLDIIGEKSLHRLIDTAITEGGSQRLLSWLSNPAPDSLTIEKRQSLVQELKGFSLFRDKIGLYSALTSGDLKGRWDANVIVDWIRRPIRTESLHSTVKLLGALAGFNLTLGALSALNVVSHIWPVTFAIYVGLIIARQGQITSAWGDLKLMETALRRFRLVFKYLESREHKNRPGLAMICSPFLDQRKRPSAELRRVERMASALGLRTNPILWLIIHLFIPWDFYFTYRLELLKKDIAQLIPIWLDAWYEIEALNSLASFAYLNPNYVFPEIVREPTLFDALALGHPLIKPGFKVCNDIDLQQYHRIVILTGSNMAGKSTLIKTVGINLCLGYAGAPVNAGRLRTSVFRIFTCINVTDSVQDGLSYFYAEVKRLKALLSAVNAEDDRPVLFLIDEIYRGTNNRERHIGSRALIRALSSRRMSVGVIATHDLELATLAEEITGIVNLHLREEVRNGRIVFDYQLRSGACPTTNALQIMQMEGLPIGL